MCVCRVDDNKKIKHKLIFYYRICIILLPNFFRITIGIV